MNRIRTIRIYVRNKQKYNPATFSNNLQYVDITDFAGTTIGSIKEECRRNNAARIDDLFFNNEPLADDRSVAHYNLENGTILETTSNPLWVACMNIKIVEVERERDAHPHDKGVQKWTEKSYIRKRTILSVLLNSKSEFPRQPPHLHSVESLVEYLKTLGKKGTEMNPYYTQKDLQQFYNEYLTFDLDQADPIGSFLKRQAARLGFDGTRPQTVAVNAEKKAPKRKLVAPRNTKTSTVPHSRKKSEKQDVICEDCQSSRADMYCPDCQGVAEKQGVCLCTMCADKLHQGALKRDHNVRDILAAPHAPKQYVPHPYRSPFAILIGMYSGLMDLPPVLSMSEDDIKLRAQPFTDTDLQDKQTGRYVGGFDCLENTLMKKGFVQKEAAARHTFSLTTAGQQLGERLYLFHEAVTIFRSANQVPDIPCPPTSFQCGTRRLYLVIDDKERDLTRFCNLAKAHGIHTLIRSLPAGDYLWILSPPLASPSAEYDGNNKAAELVLPFLVERKSWNDYYNTWKTSRFERQINNMKASGLRNCFYLVEGSIKNLRFVSPEQQGRIKDQLETLVCEERFYVNYTSSWSKSALWFVWMTFLVAAAYKQGLFTNCRLTYPDLQRNITRKLTSREIQRQGHAHVWLGQDLVSAVLSDCRKEQLFSMTCDNNFGSVETSHSTSQLLVIEGLEAYNKQRSSLLNRCLESVMDTSERELQDEVAQFLKPEVESLLHYDVFSYWQLYIQVNYGVHVVRTEHSEDTARIQADFVGAGRAQGVSVRVQETPASEMFHFANHSHDDQREDKAKTKRHVGPDGTVSEVPETDFAPDSQTEDHMIRMAMEQSRLELESLPTSTTISHTEPTGQVLPQLPSTISGCKFSQSSPTSHYGSNRSCVTHNLPIQPEANSNEYIKADLKASPCSKAAIEVISVDDSQEDCNEAPSSSTAIVITLEDSQEDQNQTEPCGQSACGPDWNSSKCLQSSGASVDDPLVLEDSQEFGYCKTPDNEQVITLKDSQEGFPQSQHHLNKVKEAGNQLEINSQEQIGNVFKERQKQKESVVKIESNISSNLMDMLTEEEQLKLALNQSLCESSCSNYDPLFDENHETSSNSKTPTKRKLQRHHSPSAKVPKMTLQISEEFDYSCSKNVTTSTEIHLKKPDVFVKPNENINGPASFKQKQLPQKEIYKSSSKQKTELSNNKCAKQIMQTDSKDQIPKEQIPASETDNHPHKESLTDEEIARQMQEEFDREYKASLSQNLSLSQPTRCLRSKREDNSFETEMESSPSQKATRKCVENLKTENSSEMNMDNTLRLLNEGSGSCRQERRPLASDVCVSKGVCPAGELFKTDGGPKVVYERQSLCTYEDANDPMPTNSAKSESESQNLLGFIGKKVLGCTQSVPVKQENLSNSCPTDDEELARQLQEQFDEEAQAKKDCTSLEQKSLCGRTIQKDSSVKASIVENSGVIVKSEEMYVKGIQPQENKSLIENNHNVFLQDLEFAQRLQMDESRNASSVNQSINNDQDFARKLQMEENWCDLKGNPRTLEDEEYARRILLEDKDRGLIQNQNTKLTKDGPFAQSIQFKDKQKAQSLAEDEELAKRMQLQENKYEPEKNSKQYLSQDEELAWRMQNEERIRQPDPELINQDEEFAKRMQMEDEFLGKTDDSLDRKQIRGQSEDWSHNHEQKTKQDHVTGTRKTQMLNRAGTLIADQLSSYRESQRSKFADRTTPTKMQLDSRSSKMTSTTTAPGFGNHTPSRPLPSPQPRMPSSTMSPCQRPQESMTSPKTVAVPVGKVVPYSVHTSSTFNGSGKKTSNGNRSGGMKVDLKEEQKIHTIDITDSDENKAGVEECSPSTSLVVKNMRCGNCKQLGHPRTFSQCPYFYTLAEVQRREAKAKENLKRREEKAKESEETLALLSNSERILKERKQAMLSQLQAEAEKVEEEFTHQIEALSRVVKKREKRGRKK